MNSRVIIGIVCLILAATAIGGYQVLHKEEVPPPEVVQVSGLIGGEKSEFLANPAVQKILKERYNIEVDANRAGSIDIVTRSNYDGMDFLWPSNEVAEALYKERNGSSVRSETVFSSPIVFFSWQPVVDALIAEGIVTLQDDIYYVVDMRRLVDLILSGKTWEEIGVNELGDSTIRVISTDPTESNSGNMFYGLLANILSTEEVVTSQTINDVLPTLEQYYQRQGNMLVSSGDMFEQYITLGMGASPIIVGYENQLVEFYIKFPELRTTLSQETRILYPSPTVWARHPLIALNDNGERLLTALQDEEIQQIAWSQHGFRSQIPSINNPATLAFTQGVPQRIDRVLNLPRPSIMEVIVQHLEKLK